jgi:hypothetical protein
MTTTEDKRPCANLEVFFADGGYEFMRVPVVAGAFAEIDLGDRAGLATRVRATMPLDLEET